MKLTICFIIVCVDLIVGASLANGDSIQEKPLTDKVLGCSLEILLEKMIDIERIVLGLQFGQHELQEQVVSNKALQKNSFADVLWAINRLEERLEKDLGRNLTVLQDQSMMILEQQTACSSHDQLRDKMFNFTPQNSQELIKSQKDISSLYKSRLLNCLSTSALQRESNTPVTTPAFTSPSTTSSTTPPTTTTTSTTSTTTTTTPGTTTTTTTPKPKLPPFTLCQDVPTKVSGVYLIRANNGSAPFKAYCEQEQFGGGWLVVQHRFDGSVDFYRNWTQYRDGFGEVDKEFWIGLEKIHQITTTSAHEIIFEIKDFSGKYGYARYNGFQIGSESEKYTLKNLGSYSGNASDSMTNYSKGAMFSTMDQDNDGSSDYHWAVFFKGAWWHGSGTASNLNGPYRNTIDYKTINWLNFVGMRVGLSFSRMMIREL
ncbi:angiopoietin-related protein 1-like [Anopheles albimanus]|uniref:angiopoietin-related protein 1-like n=1 Tax=Anopheles albimanus TaxID=7167 RepID=UPI00163EFBB3|nr:angiopoietin-related protein 1-like [Anopheles albimanus]